MIDLLANTRVGSVFRGEVLDVAGNNGVESPQVKAAFNHVFTTMKATKHSMAFPAEGIISGMSDYESSWAERERIANKVMIRVNSMEKTDFAESKDVVIKGDPPSGHMAGPKALR